MKRMISSVLGFAMLISLFGILFQPFEPLVELAASVQSDLLRVELVLPVPLVHVHRAAHDHLLAFGHTKRSEERRVGKECRL